MNSLKHGIYSLGVFLLVLNYVCAWSQSLTLSKKAFLLHSWRLRSVVNTHSGSPLKDYTEALGDRLLHSKVKSLVLRKPRKLADPSVPTILLEIQSVKGRYVQLRGEAKYQLAYRYKTNEQVKNYNITDVANIIETIVGTGVFKAATFASKEEQHNLVITMPPGVNQTLYSYNVKQLHPPKGETHAVGFDVNTMTHDRVKNTLIAIDAPFLEVLGITYKDTGSKVSITRPRVGMVPKLGQIQKFVEILDGLVKSALDVQVGTKTDFRIADMGSGLAYLTFAVHAHFQRQFPTLQTIGVERRAELANRTNAIARGLGQEFNGLHFQPSRIEDVVHSAHTTIADPMQKTNDNEKNRLVDDHLNDLDVLMALHACDTATDDAILQGITNNASIIIVSPCCHKEVRRQLEKHHGQLLAFVDTTTNDCGLHGNLSIHPLSNVLQHGIYRERHAEMVTDTLRALCLECAGYDTKIFEFVSGEHTVKNTMIAATKRTGPLAGVKKEAVVKKIHDLMGTCGIKTQRLVTMLQLD